MLRGIQIQVVNNPIGEPKYMAKRKPVESAVATAPVVVAAPVKTPQVVDDLDALADQTAAAPKAAVSAKKDEHPTFTYKKDEVIEEVPIGAILGILAAAMSVGKHTEKIEKGQKPKAIDFAQKLQWLQEFRAGTPQDNPVLMTDEASALFQFVDGGKVIVIQGSTPEGTFVTAGVEAGRAKKIAADGIELRKDTRTKSMQELRDNPETLALFGKFMTLVTGVPADKRVGSAWDKFVAFMDGLTPAEKASPVYGIFKGLIEGLPVDERKALVETTSTYVPKPDFHEIVVKTVAGIDSKLPPAEREALAVKEREAIDSVVPQTIRVSGATYVPGLVAATQVVQTAKADSKTTTTVRVVQEPAKAG